MRKFLFVILILATGFSGCGKLEASDTVLEESIRQEKKITDFLTANTLTAKRHYSGMYYIISDPGSSANPVAYFSGTSVTTKYIGRFLDGTVFTNVTSPGGPYFLANLIPGWQYGLPLIQKGGKIRLFVPSILAYGQSGVAGSNPPIPPNSVLDFEIELVDVHN